MPETSPLHTHYCPECRETWSHDDPACGPAQQSLLDDALPCPRCQRAQSLEWQSHEPIESPDDLDELALRAFEDEGGPPFADKDHR